MKFDASHQVKWNKSLTAAAISHAEGVFHARRAFHKSRKGFISLKKALANASAFFLAPPVGLEPTTLRLTAACSTDWAKEECFYRPVLVGGNLCRRRLIFPGGCPPSIVSTNELNYRVRNGNGWTLIVIDTDFRAIFVWPLSQVLSYNTTFPDNCQGFFQSFLKNLNFF